MRSFGPYTCPKCEVVAGVPGSCHRCGREMLDREGQPGPSGLLSGTEGGSILSRRRERLTLQVGLGLPALLAGLVPVLASKSRTPKIRFFSEAPEIGWLRVGPHGIDWGGGFILAAILIMPLGAVVSLGVLAACRRIGRTRHRARLTARRAEAERTPRRPAAEAEAGLVRIRGRVRVLDPVSAEGEPADVAALLLPGRRYCGRFLVQDDTSAALVDDDFVELWSDDDRSSIVRIRQGDAVEVAGPGERRPVPEAGAYRDAVLFAFDGRPGEPLHITKLPSA